MKDDRQFRFLTTRTAVTVLVSAVTSIVVFLALQMLGPLLRPEWQAALFPALTQRVQTTSTLRLPSTAPSGGSDALTLEDRVTIDAVNKASPAVVAILVTANVKPAQRLDAFDLDPYGQLFRPRQEQEAPQDAASRRQEVGGGSGFFVTSDGIVVTNKHVAQNQAFGDGVEYTVLTNDGQKIPAKLLATDPVLDLAFLKVEGSGYPTLPFGDSEKIVAGQTVIAIGNALGEFRNTVTKGVISGLNRRIVAGDDFDSELIEEAIQTDAAINPGNSGGPLIDLQGNVVGVNTAVSERGQLLGFALPISIVKRDLANVQKSGRIVRPFMGVRYVLITEDVISKNQLKVDHGALIIRGVQQNELAIAPGSPADKAGLKENDIILEVDGVRVDEEHSLASLIGKRNAGDEVALKVSSGGTEKIVKLTLDELKTP